MIPARWRWRVGTALVLAVVVFLVVRGSNRPEDPELAPPATTIDDGERAGSDGGGGGSAGEGEREPLEGFEEVAFRISPAGAEASTWCALLAAELEQRQQGLSDQDDLRGYEAMVFRFGEPSTTRFTMMDTRVPLSIAFFDADGAFVSLRDMDPCPPDSTTCATYGAEAPFLHALEVEQGGLAALGIGPGSRLSFPDGPCPAA